MDDGYLYISGQLGLDPVTLELKNGIQEQTKQVLLNIEAILKSCKFKKENIIKITIYTTDLSMFNVINESYASFLEEHKPVRTTVEVKALPKNAMIEIETMAYMGK
jgi:2-iminobutanoate/2-iminopropanoate deaminase